jgi:general secretion pathway protein J
VTRSNATLYQREAGFTLVELLVALSVLGLLAVAITGGIDFGRRAWERSDQVASRFESEQLTLDALGDWIEGAHLFKDITGDRRVTYPLVGREESLTLSTPLYRDGMRDELYRVAVFRDNAQATLNAAWTEDRSGQVNPEDDPDAKRRSLMRDVSALQFRYFEPGLNASRGRWVESWQGKRDLPRAIEISLTMGDGRNRTIVARPRMTREADCIFDPVSRDCR